MKNKLVIEQIPIGELKTAEYNPRKWTAEARAQLTASLDEFGFMQPIIANSNPERRGVVIGGNFKLSIAREKKLETLPVVWIDLDLKKEKELNLRLNKAQGEFDYFLLADFEKEMLKEVGFESADLDKIFKDEEEDDFDLEKELANVAEPTSKLGEIYQLGRHVLMCGDSTDKKSVENLMGGVRADMVFTDPPYNVDYQGGGSYAENGKPKREKIANDKMSAEQFKEFLNGAIANMLRHTSGAFYICMSSRELAALKDVFEKNGGHWQSFIIWAKNTFTLGRSDWQNQYEPILYGWNEGLKNHYFVGWRDEGNVWDDVQSLKPIFDGKTTKINLGEYHLELDGEVTGKVINKKDITDIWKEKKPSRSAEHPTMKPLKLVEKAIRASSMRDDVVLDLFLGSGSTLIACEKTERICYGMELSPKYVDVIISRWEKETGKKAQKIN